MRIVLDTSVSVAAMRSSSGASARLIEMALNREFELLLSVSLCLKYEAVLKRPEHSFAAGLNTKEIDHFLDAILDESTAVHLGFFWPTSAQDIDDTHVLALAAEGSADLLVTHNVRDFKSSAADLGIYFHTPSGALRRLRS